MSPMREARPHQRCTPVTTMGRWRRQVVRLLLWRCAATYLHEDRGLRVPCDLSRSHRGRHHSTGTGPYRRRRPGPEAWWT